MFNPKSSLLIKKIPGEGDFICLGWQFVLIIEFLKDLLPQHKWYGADVEATEHNVPKHSSRFNIEEPQVNLIGTDKEFIQYCLGVNQFIWGVFVCFDSKYAPPKNLILETEFDEPFRPIPCEGILLEIQTFDTTYFAIYSEDEEVLKKLSQKFVFSEFERKSQDF